MKIFRKSVLIAIVLFAFIEGNAQVTLEQMAPEISLPNANGNIVSLSSFKGKIVLVDFWAIWCNPCRAANPKIVKLYNKYKANGLEIFGVALDKTKSKWLAAVKKDKITYTQVIDTEGWESDAAIAYGVEAIPTSFLLDKTGKIVAIDLEGDELENKIKELLAL
ncbi:MAG: TlpA family protein disulfide reductase [Chitinophagaceae bacterium]|nr:TlpA family protein disulfide reductase [Chitinophagaceae bacterium]